METRCPPLDNPIPALKPGSLNKMFERIVAEAPGNRTLTEQERLELKAKNMTEYSVKIHSRPSETPVTEVSQVQDKSLPPWVITFEDFITPEECDAIVQLGYKHGYERSVVSEVPLFFLSLPECSWLISQFLWSGATDFLCWDRVSLGNKIGCRKSQI